MTGKKTGAVVNYQIVRSNEPRSTWRDFIGQRQPGNFHVGLLSQSAKASPPVLNSSQNFKRRLLRGTPTLSLSVSPPLSLSEISGILIARNAVVSPTNGGDFESHRMRWPRRSQFRREAVLEAPFAHRRIQFSDLFPLYGTLLSPFPTALSFQLSIVDNLYLCIFGEPSSGHVSRI